MYNCTVQGEAHTWTVPTLPESYSVVRGSPIRTEGNVYRFELVEDNGNALLTSLTIVVFAGLDGVTISCDDATNPGRGLVEEATASVLG